MVEKERKSASVGAAASPALTYDEIQQQAAVDYMEEQIEEAENPRYVNIVTDVLPPPSRWSRVRPHLDNPWVVAVGSGLIITAMVALISLIVASR